MQTVIDKDIKVGNYIFILFKKHTVPRADEAPFFGIFKINDIIPENIEKSFVYTKPIFSEGPENKVFQKYERIHGGKYNTNPTWIFVKLNFFGMPTSQFFCSSPKNFNGCGSTGIKKMAIYKPGSNGGLPDDIKEKIEKFKKESGEEKFWDLNPALATNIGSNASLSIGPSGYTF